MSLEIAFSGCMMVLAGRRTLLDLSAYDIVTY